LGYLDIEILIIASAQGSMFNFQLEVISKN